MILNQSYENSHKTQYGIHKTVEYHGTLFYKKSDTNIAQISEEETLT